MSLIYTREGDQATVSFGVGLRGLSYPANFTLKFENPNDLTVAELVPHPVAPWNGPEDGLPPAGTVCESVCAGVVRKVEILCVTEAHVFIRDLERSTEWLWNRQNPGSRTFRPIRTAEQLAAEAHRANYIPQLIKLWDADTERTEFLEAVYALIVEAGKP